MTAHIQPGITLPVVDGPRFGGLFGVLVTPFRDDGSLDDAGVDRLVEFYLGHGVHGLMALTVAGEGGLLLPWERLRVAKRVLSLVRGGAVAGPRGRVPVVIGALGTGSRDVAVFSQQVAELGASAVMVAPPAMGPGTTDDAIVDHYGEVAQRCGLPIVALNYPDTGAMSPAFLVRLARAVPAVRAVKHEVPPTPQTIAELRLAVGDQLAILGGLGGLYSLSELEHGADGMMTGFAFPEVLVEIYDAMSAGDVAGAAAVYARWLPVLLHEGQPGIGIAARKELLRLRGVMACAQVRAPTPRLSSLARAQLGRVVERVFVDCARSRIRAAS